MNYKKCKHVKQIGQMAVYVTPGCPNGHLIKGYFVTTKHACENCKGDQFMRHKRHQKKSEDTIARIKNTEPAIKHRDGKAEEWMKRKPYGGILSEKNHTGTR